MKIADIPIDNRPMERMVAKGVSVLSDAEVLAIILQKGTRSENVIDVSNRLISKYELSKLSSLSLTELMSVDGIGRVKGMQILAAFELGKRVN